MTGLRAIRDRDGDEAGMRQDVGTLPIGIGLVIALLLGAA
jgi:hypothetical protein